MENKCKLFVRNLPWSVRNDSLADHFGAAGKVVDAIVIMDRATNRSKGFGFVTMSTEDEAQKAIQMFNEQEMEGRQIFVNIAKPKEE